MAVLVPPSFEGVPECGVVGVECELMLEASAEEVWRGRDGRVTVEGGGVLLAGVSGSSAGEAATATFTRASNLVLLPPLAGCG